MNKTLAIVVVIVAAGAAVTFALMDLGGETPSDETFDPSVPATEEEMAGLEGRADETAIDIETGGNAAGRITGVVRSGGTGVPARVAVFRGGNVNPVDPRRPDVDERRSSMRDMMAAQLGVTWEPATASAEADDDGTFSFGTLPSGFYAVWATDAEGRQGYAPLIVPVTGAARYVEIALAEQGSDLAVRVMKGDTPYGGALYVISAERGDFGGPTARADLDAEGRAWFAALPGSQVRLIAFASHESLVVSGPVDIPQDGEYVWTIDANTTPATGKVVDPDDNGVAGATVVVMAGNPAAGMVMETGTTSADGTFSIDVPGKAQMLQATAAGYANGRGGPGPDGQILIRLTPLTSVSGQVVRADGGTPVSGARILARSLASRHDRSMQHTISDANGRFALAGMQPGEVMVFVLGGGVLSQDLWKVQTDGYNPLAFDLGADGRTDLVLEVVDGPSLEGHVYDASGAPVAGAIVTPQMTDSTMGEWSWRGGTEGVAVTDDGGRFVFDVLVPTRTYTLTAEPANRPKARLEGVVVQLDVAPGPVEIRLPAERWLDVVVTDTDGDPVSNAWVRVSKAREDGGWNGVEGQWSTNAAGAARVGPLGEGSIGVRVASDEHVDQDEPLPVPDESPRFEVTLDTGFEISGTIEYDDVVEAVETRVTARSESVPGERTIRADGTVRADGTFRIAGLPRGRYTVNARSFGPVGRQEGSATVDAPSTDVVIKVGASDATPRFEGGRTESRVAISVLMPDGTPVTEGNIRVYSSSGRYGTNITPRTTASIGKGEDVWIEVHGLPASITDKAGAGLYGPFSGDTDPLTIQLEPATTVTGRIVGPDGQGVKGVRLAVVPDNPKRDNWGRFRDAATARTDDDGRFEVKGLKSGSYLADVSVPPAFVKPDTVRFDGGDTNVRIELDQGLAPTVTVVDYDGKPVEGAQLSVREQKEGDPRHHSFGAQASSGRTGADGTCVLQGLARDRNYTLSVIIDADLHPTLIGRHVQDWTPNDITVDLERAYLATGVVRGTDGTPIKSATVWWQVPGESGASGVGTGDDGRFRIGPQNAPEIDVWVNLGGGAFEEGTERMRIKADAKDVELVIDPGVTLEIRIQGWVDGDPRQASLSPEDSSGHSANQRVGDGGLVAFPHLGGDKTYRLWIPGGTDERYVLRRGIRGDAGRVTVSQERGKSIRGRVTGRQGIDLSQTWLSLHQNDIGAVSVRASADGTFEVKGLPDGTWYVNASNWSGEQVSATAQIEAGTSGVVLELKKSN